MIHCKIAINLLINSQTFYSVYIFIAKSTFPNLILNNFQVRVPCYNIKFFIRKYTRYIYTYLLKTNVKFIYFLNIYTTENNLGIIHSHYNAK